MYDVYDAIGPFLLLNRIYMLTHIIYRDFKVNRLKIDSIPTTQITLVS